MKTICLTLTVFAHLFVYAQNVGVGTPTPAAKMQINSTATLGRPTLKLYDSSSSSGPTIEFQNASSSNYWQMGGITHASDPSQSFIHYYTNTSPFLLSIRGDANVGIGGINPQQRLHIYSDAGFQNSFALFNNLATGAGAGDGLIAGINLTGNAIINNQETNRSLFLGTGGVNRLSIGTTGNIGMGIDAASAPLHVRTTNAEVLRLEGNAPYVSFYNGTTYKGYLWYDGARMVLGSSTNEPILVQANYTGSPAYFTPNGRLGLGQASPTERLDVNGNINLTGLLKVNGNGGTSGQVLTSNGASDPTWTDAALSSNIRFSVAFSNGPTTNDYGVITATRYNLNPAEVVISASSITINQSGLYHFDVGVKTNLNFPSAATIFPFFGLDFFYGLPNSLPLVDDKPLYPSTAGNTSWVGNEKVSVEVHVTAPATIRVFHTFFGSSGSSFYSVAGFITGHLINE